MKVITIVLCGVILNSCAAFSRINMFTIDDERRLGRDIAIEIERTVQISSRADSISAYVDSLGIAIVNRCNLSKYQFIFKVIESDDVNAFAIPAGGIYINKGLVDFVDTSDQLVGVIMHEIGHVMRRHGTRALTRAYGVSCIIELGLNGVNEDKYYRGVAEVAAMLTGQLTMMKYSRSAEQESDHYAVDQMMKAGYEPTAYADFIKKLISIKTKNSRVMNIFSTHPEMGDRLDRVNEQIESQE